MKVTVTNDESAVGPAMKSKLSAICLILIAIAGCRTMDEVADSFRDMTPYEAYTESLRSAGLDQTALGQDWLRSGEEALNRPVTVTTPYSEEGFLPEDRAHALGYRIPLERGQALEVEVEIISPDTTGVATKVFVDLYRGYVDEEDEPLLVESMDSASHVLAYEASRKSDYILRLQPELLRGGQYRVTIRWGASLDFPVEGLSTSAVLSFFGADRDAGRRTHHGVDIFAPRGTPALAAADGVVTRVEVTPRGGRVVWMRDQRRNANLYYAHLDSQLVEEGMRVRRGDPVGLVGNTGNARTTPPHLHFGIYVRRRGPVDPWYYLLETPRELPALVAEIDQVGDWVRINSDGIRMRAAPSTRGDVVTELPRFTTLEVVAVAGDWYRIRLPDGRPGFVAARLTEPLDGPVELSGLALATDVIQTHPDDIAPVLDRIDGDSKVSVLGTFEDYLFVQASNGLNGWVAGTWDSQQQ